MKWNSLILASKYTRILTEPIKKVKILWHWDSKSLYKCFMYIAYLFIRITLALQVLKMVKIIMTLRMATPTWIYRKLSYIHCTMVPKRQCWRNGNFWTIAGTVNRTCPSTSALSPEDIKEIFTQHSLITERMKCVIHQLIHFLQALLTFPLVLCLYYRLFTILTTYFLYYMYS